MGILEEAWGINNELDKQRALNDYFLKQLKLIKYFSRKFSQSSLTSKAAFNLIIGSSEDIISISFSCNVNVMQC